MESLLIFEGLLVAISIAAGLFLFKTTNWEDDNAWENAAGVSGATSDSSDSGISARQKSPEITYLYPTKFTLPKGINLSDARRLGSRRQEMEEWSGKDRQRNIPTAAIPGKQFITPEGKREIPYPQGNTTILAVVNNLHEKNCRKNCHQFWATRDGWNCECGSLRELLGPILASLATR
jgi:hypothetical protein